MLEPSLTEVAHVRRNFGFKFIGGGWGGALYLGSVLCIMPSAVDVAKAQNVAKRKFQNFKKVCKVVYQRKGAHSGL